MSSSEDIMVTERGKDKDNNKKEGGGFIHKVKGFIHDIGKKIEEAAGFGKPTANVFGIHISHIDLHHADLINNPNPVPIPLVDIDYIDSDGQKLVSGLTPDASTIHAHRHEIVKIPVSLVLASDDRGLGSELRRAQI